MNCAKPSQFISKFRQKKSYYFENGRTTRVN